MKMICINCPKGCEMDVTVDGSAVTVAGNACPKGEAYAKSEVTNPTRMVTGLVRVAGMRKPLPVKIGDVIIPNVAETEVDIVATANM